MSRVLYLRNGVCFRWLQLVMEGLHRDTCIEPWYGVVIKGTGSIEEPEGDWHVRAGVLVTGRGAHGIGCLSLHYINDNAIGLVLLSVNDL